MQAALTRAYGALLHGLALIAAFALGITAVLVAGDVVARNIGLGTLPWILEASEYSLPLATFLVAPWLLHRNEHVRLDMLLVAAPPRARAWLNRIADAAGLLICIVFVVYGAKVVADSARLGSMVIKSIVFPEWWIYVPVPLAFTLLAIEFVARLRRGTDPVSAGPAALATQE